MVPTDLKLGVPWLDQAEKNSPFSFSLIHSLCLEEDTVLSVLNTRSTLQLQMSVSHYITSWYRKKKNVTEPAATQTDV